jgi:hypothetical protein
MLLVFALTDVMSLINLPPMSSAKRTSRQSLWLDVLSAIRCGGKSHVSVFSLSARLFLSIEFSEGYF